MLSRLNAVIMYHYSVVKKSTDQTTVGFTRTGSQFSALLISRRESASWRWVDSRGLHSFALSSKLCLRELTGQTWKANANSTGWLRSLKINISKYGYFSPCCQMFLKPHEWDCKYWWAAHICGSVPLLFVVCHEIWIWIELSAKNRNKAEIHRFPFTVRNSSHISRRQDTSHSLHWIISRFHSSDLWKCSPLFAWGTAGRWWMAGVKVPLNNAASSPFARRNDNSNKKKSARGLISSARRHSSLDPTFLFCECVSTLRARGRKAEAKPSQRHLFSWSAPRPESRHLRHRGDEIQRGEENRRRLRRRSHPQPQWRQILIHCDSFLFSNTYFFAILAYITSQTETVSLQTKSTIIITVL